MIVETRNSFTSNLSRLVSQGGKFFRVKVGTAVNKDSHFIRVDLAMSIHSWIYTYKIVYVDLSRMLL